MGIRSMSLNYTFLGTGNPRTAPQLPSAVARFGVPLVAAPSQLSNFSGSVSRARLAARTQGKPVTTPG